MDAVNDAGFFLPADLGPRTVFFGTGFDMDGDVGAEDCIFDPFFEPIGNGVCILNAHMTTDLEMEVHNLA